MDGDDSNSEYTKSACGATSNSKLLDEERKPCGCNRKKEKQAKAHGKKEKKTKKDDNEAPAKNTCPHCKKSNAGSHIASTQKNACGTKHTKDTVSNPSATSLR